MQNKWGAISSVASNARSSSQLPRAQQSYPAIAYFIVYRETQTCNENLLFAAMHNHDMEPEISPIQVRSSNQIEKAAKQLFQVVKDHNNQTTIQEMLDISNVYCYRNADSSSDDKDSEDEIHPTRFLMVPCVQVVVNEMEFGER